MGFVNNNTGVNTGAFPAQIKPMPQKMTLPDNYINFHDSNFSTWTQQYLPELYEAEVERYGNRTLSGFLRMVGAEMPMTSDQVIWSEQNRLHIAYEGVERTTSSSNVFKIPGNFALKINNTVLLANGNTTAKCIVSAIDIANSEATLLPYQDADITGAFGSLEDNYKLFVYGSEFPKGVGNRQDSIEPVPSTFSNSPIIMKDYFEVSGSDTAQIGWIEIAAEDGSAGYFWYMKSEAETRLRFEDYMEMMCVEGVKADAGSGA